MFGSFSKRSIKCSVPNPGQDIYIYIYDIQISMVNFWEGVRQVFFFGLMKPKPFHEGSDGFSYMTLARGGQNFNIMSVKLDIF